MRPKTIKYHAGEITFKNIPVAVREEVINKIKGPKMVPEYNEETEEYKLVPEVVKDLKEKEEAVKPKDLPNKGLSFVKVGNTWSVIEIFYNLETKDAEVRNIIPLHSNRNIAIDKFRVKFFKEI